MQLVQFNYYWVTWW